MIKLFWVEYFQFFVVFSLGFRTLMHIYFSICVLPKLSETHRTVCLTSQMRLI